MKPRYRSMEEILGMNRRDFLRGMGACTVAAGGLFLGVPPLYGEEEEAEEEETKERKPEEAQRKKPREIETNIDEYMKTPRTGHGLPGRFPGRVVKVTNPASMTEGAFNSDAIRAMLEQGITRMTGRNMKESFDLLIDPGDIVGLKVNPVGPPLINTRLEVTEAVIRWLVDSGLPRENIVIWDRFDVSLERAGYTQENFPGIRIEALQGFELDEEGKHKSADRFDMDASYYAKGVLGTTGDEKKDKIYLMQHVYTEEHSYFGKLVTQELTKIINIPAFKNTGNGVSMATKNLAYAVICNAARLHRPLFFRVCTEVMAAPWVRDKTVLNILDGLRAQYEGGPALEAQFVYDNHSLYFATDPFALDMIGHRELVAKRKEMKVKVDESPRYTDYLYEGQKLGLGIADPEMIELIEVTA